MSDVIRTDWPCGGHDSRKHLDIARPTIGVRIAVCIDMLERRVATNAILDVMVAEHAEEPRILLRNVPWSTYVSLNDAVDSRNVVMTYLEGQLEIVTKSGRHEVSKIMIARLVELFCLERDIPLYGFGETTVRKQRRKRGLEPDGWYSRSRKPWPPEIAVEVIVTSPLIDKLEVYRGLGVREVWVYKHAKRAFEIMALRGERYVSRKTSALFPQIDFARIAHYAQHPDQHAALKAFRRELQRAQR